MRPAACAPASNGGKLADLGRRSLASPVTRRAGRSLRDASAAAAAEAAAAAAAVRLPQRHSPLPLPCAWPGKRAFEDAGRRRPAESDAPSSERSAAPAAPAAPAAAAAAAEISADGLCGGEGEREPGRPGGLPWRRGLAVAAAAALARARAFVAAVATHKSATIRSVSRVGEARRPLAP